MGVGVAAVSVHGCGCGRCQCTWVWVWPLSVYMGVGVAAVSVHGCGCGRCQCVAFATASDVLLVGGSGPHEGRVEVYHNGTWGTVCGDGWDLRDATVVCRQLGNLKAEAAVLGSAWFGAGSGPILFSELSCIGNESVIAECGHDDSGGHNCSHSEDVGVVCGQSVCVCGGGGCTLSFTSLWSLLSSDTAGCPNLLKCVCVNFGM